MSPADCPDQQRMKAYALGKLSADSLESVSGHVEACPDCQSTLVSLKNAEDTMISELRGAAATAEFEEEPEFRDAAAKAAALIQPPAATPAVSPATGERTVPNQPQGVKSPPVEAKLKPSANPAGPPMPLSLEQFTKALADTGLVSPEETTRHWRVCQRINARPTCKAWLSCSSERRQADEVPGPVCLPGQSQLAYLRRVCRARQDRRRRHGPGLSRPSIDAWSGPWR